MTATRPRGKVLIVAGSDSGGGAGIQADIKAVTALGGYAMTAITALTAQNTRGVEGVVGIDPGFISLQMRLVLDDLGADCVKTGMLHTGAVIQAATETLADAAPDVPLVADPVMYAKGGHALLEPEAVDALRRLLLPRATIVTPNLPEAAALAGMEIPDVAAMHRAGAAILALGPQAVLVKGGHFEGPTITDVLCRPDGAEEFSGPRIDTPHTHGTGCTLASAVATGLAQGQDLVRAVARARDYVRIAIETAPGFGHGHGPLNHLHALTPFDG
jgi:hydroxymethylpyrimidine/phosphomethylpyrimidine kinase